MQVCRIVIQNFRSLKAVDQRATSTISCGKQTLIAPVSPRKPQNKTSQNEAKATNLR